MSKFIQSSFKFPESFKAQFQRRKGQFGSDGFGEVVYARTYARNFGDRSEVWGDTVLRVTEGTFSILKSHLQKNHLEWNEQEYQEIAYDFADSMFDLKWSPPGRGLWGMGTNHVKNHGSMALNNCGFVDTTDLIDSSTWTMDALMRGCGVGFNTSYHGILKEPKRCSPYTVPDSREGWVESLAILLSSFEHGNDYPIFDYSEIRPPGSPIRGFGGVSSGYQPLKKLHSRIRNYCAAYTLACGNDTFFEVLPESERNDIEDYLGTISLRTYSSSRFIVDVFNAIGACIVSGNIRRSSQIAIGPGNDSIFLKLKDSTFFPERQEISWNSNNTIRLEQTSDFSRYLPGIARQIKESGNGEPGLMNQLNIQRYGRVHGKKSGTREDEPDAAIGLNPCGEIPLESYELCNVVETFPSRCVKDGKFSLSEFQKACYCASLYASIVATLPTDSIKTNAVMGRNRRIGVSVSGSSRLYEEKGYSQMIEVLREGHKVVRETNRHLMKTAGLPESLRVTTVKPSGTISKLAGVPEGLHFPLAGRFILRRIRIAQNSPIAQQLIEAQVPYEQDISSDNTYVFEFPIDQGSSRSIDQVSIWEQVKVAELHQRWWSENSCSATFMYSSSEARHLEELIATSIPNLKSMSFAPQSDMTYQQAPIEKIDEKEYAQRKKGLKEFSIASPDSFMPLYCDTSECEKSTMLPSDEPLPPRDTSSDIGGVHE